MAVMRKAIRVSLFTLIALIPAVIGAFENVEIALEIGAPRNSLLSYPSSVAFDEEGRIYVADSGNYQVAVFGLDGKLIRKWGERGKGPGQFMEPFGIAYLDGQVFVTDSKLDRVEVFSSDGKFQYQFGGAGNEPGKLKIPRGIVVSGQGRLYVAEAGSALISVFTPQGVYMGTVAAGTGEVKNPTHLTMDRSGNVYVSDPKFNLIQVFNPEGAPLRVINGSELGIGCVSGMAVSQRGYLLVADAVGRIFLLDPKGKADNPFGSPGSTRGQFKDVGGIALGEDGRLAIADSGNDRVIVLKAPLPENTPILPAAKSLSTVVLDPPVLSPARDVAIGDSGMIFALGLQGAAVKAYMRRGTPKFVINPEFKGKGSRIATGNGKIYVSDYLNDNVTVYSQENGKFLFRFGKKGKNPGEFVSPGGIAVTGKVFVADTGNDRVQVFSLDGVYLNTLGDESTQLKKPSDVTVGPGGKIYVADSGNKRIVMFRPDGHIEKVIGDREMFRRIVAIRVDEDNRIFVLEADGQERVRVLSQQGKVVMRFGARGSGPGDFLAPEGMDLFRGVLFVADTGNDRILRFKLMDVPAEPAGLHVVTGPDGSMLKWKKGTESFLQGYRIYAVDESGKRETIGETDQPEFKLPLPMKGGQTRFTVTAFSRNGLESVAPPPITDWVRIGLAELQAGRQKEAAQAFEKALLADPNDPYPLEQLGRIFITLKEYDKAKANYQKLEKNRQYAEKATLGLGIIALEQNNFEEAEKQLLKSAAFNSQNPDTQRYLAELYLKQKHWQQVLDHSKEASVLDPTNARAHEMMGLAYFNLRLYGNAGKSLGLAISLDPKNVDLYLEIAMVYRTQGQDGPAEEMLLKAAQIAPDRIEPALELGTLYLDNKKLDKADDEVETVLKSHPNSGAAYRLKGKILLARGKKEDAVEMFQKSLTLEPDDPEALVGLALAYVSLGQLKEAEAIMEKARKAHPKNETVLLASAQVRSAEGDLPGAIGDLNAVLEVNSESVEALLTKGRLHMQRKEYQVAADSFLRASKLLPGTIEPLLLLSDALVGAGRQVEAEDALRDALNINMESAQAHYALGKLYASRTDMEKAIPEFKFAAYIDPDNPLYHHALGKAFMDSAYLEEAVQSLKRASELAPNDEGVKRDLNLAMESLKKYRASGNVPPVEISRVQIKPIFAGIAKFYQDAPLGTLTLRNNANEPIYKVKISFKIKGFMDQPSVQVVDELKPRSVMEIPIKATLREKVLAIREDTPVLGIIGVEYVRGKSPQKLSTTVPFTLFGPNAILWSDKAMIGAFVTPGDWAVKEFARTARDAAGEAPEALPASLFKAIAVYENLLAYKMSYLEDPNHPYRQSSKEVERVDYVQYPRDTLRLRSGDCDDLSILFMALMENLGVETALADLPGHVLPLFDAGVDPADIANVAGDPDRVIEVEGKVWIPVEMTSLGSGFSEAWTQGVEECRKAIKEGKFGVTMTHKAQGIYAPATLSVSNWVAKMPEARDARKLVDSEVNVIARKRIDHLAANLIKRVEEDPNNQELHVELGVLYAKNGDVDRAKQEFEKVLSNNPNNVQALTNLGNIFLMSENYQAALEQYRAAEVVAPDDAEVKMNLALAYYHLGNVEAAKTKFEEAAEADPDMAAANQSLKDLLYH